MLNNLFFDLSHFSVIILLVAFTGLLLEEKIAIRLVLLLEVSLAAVIGYTLTVQWPFGTIGFVLIIVLLVIAAVESILLLAFIVLLHRIDQIIDLIDFNSLQF